MCVCVYFIWFGLIIVVRSRTQCWNVSLSAYIFGYPKFFVDVLLHAQSNPNRSISIIRFIRCDCYWRHNSSFKCGSFSFFLAFFFLSVNLALFRTIGPVGSRICGHFSLIIWIYRSVECHSNEKLKLNSVKWLRDVLNTQFTHTQHYEHT